MQDLYIILLSIRGLNNGILAFIFLFSGLAIFWVVYRQKMFHTPVVYLGGFFILLAVQFAYLSIVPILRDADVLHETLFVFLLTVGIMAQIATFWILSKWLVKVLNDNGNREVSRQSIKFTEGPGDSGHKPKL